MMNRKEKENQGKSRIPNQWSFLDSYGGMFRKSSLVILLFLGRDYANKYHVRDLAWALTYDVSLISRNLKELEKIGLVTHEEVGNLVYYQSNMKNVLTRQLKICFTLMEIQNLIHSLQSIATTIILYGSCARGEDTQQSDIDLFIETQDKMAVKAILDTYRKKVTREISSIVLTPDEMYTLKRDDKSLYDQIHQGIILKSEENVL